MKWHSCIDSAEKLVLELCRMVKHPDDFLQCSMNEGDGYGDAVEECYGADDEDDWDDAGDGYGSAGDDAGNGYGFGYGGGEAGGMVHGDGDGKSKSR